MIDVGVKKRNRCMIRFSLLDHIIHVTGRFDKDILNCACTIA